MLATILEFLAGKLLDWLLGLLKTQVQNTAQDMAKDKERGEINDANVKAYEAAKSRQEQVDAALAVLNRTRP